MQRACSPVLMHHGCMKSIRSCHLNLDPTTLMQTSGGLRVSMSYGIDKELLTGQFHFILLWTVDSIKPTPCWHIGRSILLYRQLWRARS